MSPESAREIDICYSLEDAVEKREDIAPLMEDFKQRYDFDTQAVAHLLFNDSWVMKTFKEAWHDPNRKLTELDRLLIEKHLESELGRSESCLENK